MADDWALEQFYHTIINARDIDETVAFYQALGFEIVRDRRNMTWPPGGGVVFGLIPDVKGRSGTLMALPNDPPRTARCWTSSSGWSPRRGSTTSRPTLSRASPPFGPAMSPAR